MSDKEKTMMRNLAKLPSAAQDKILNLVQGAVILLDVQREEANNGDDVERAAPDA